MDKPEECIELKNIKYKTMLSNGTTWTEFKSEQNLSNLEKFLENERTTNAGEPWSKLDKTIKIKKMIAFAETYKTEKGLNELETNSLILFLKDCLDRKKLQRIKDVIYDKENGLIKDIPALFHNKSTNHFTLKNIDKRVSTIKSLAPKKVRGTIKNKPDGDCVDSEEDK